MANFLRKINKQGVWKKSNLSLDPDEVLKTIPSDVFSRCMYSKDNELSIWEVSGSSWDDYGDIIATIVSGSDGPTATDLVLLDDDVMKEFDSKQTDGKAKASEAMNKKHYDLINLTHFKLGILAKYIGLKLAEDNAHQQGGRKNIDNQYVKRITERKMIDIMKKAVANGCVNKGDLSERWIEKIK